MRLFDIDLICPMLYMDDIGMMYEVLRTLRRYSRGLYGRFGEHVVQVGGFHADHLRMSLKLVCYIPMDASHCTLLALDIPSSTTNTTVLQTVTKWVSDAIYPNEVVATIHAVGSSFTLT